MALAFLDGCAGVHRPERLEEDGYVPMDLGDLLPCVESVATAISDDRVIVGWCEGQGRTTAFEYRLGNGVLTLPGLPGTSVDRAHGVNLAGDVVGESDGQAVRWRSGNRPEAIPGLPAGSRSVARAINERGAISGVVWVGARAEPFLWDTAGGTRIGAALLPPGMERPSRPPIRIGGFEAGIRDRNGAGSVLLSLETSGQTSSGAVLRPDGRLWRLAPAGGGAGVEPHDLSDTCEWIVGSTLTEGGHRRATWWRRDC